MLQQTHCAEDPELSGDQCSKRDHLLSFNLVGSIRKEVEDIPQCGCVPFVELGIATSGTGHRCEFLILHIENFRPATACGSHSVCLILCILAFWALPLNCIHDVLPLVVLGLQSSHLWFRFKAVHSTHSHGVEQGQPERIVLISNRTVY